MDLWILGKSSVSRMVMFAAVLLTYGLLGESSQAQDQNWVKGFGPQSFSAPMSALALNNLGDLYAGGQFNGLSGFNHIALWNGRHWSGLHSGATNGTSQAVNAILTMGTNVFVAGNFATIDTNDVGFIAEWNGTNWSRLGNGSSVGVSSNVYALAGAGSNIYAGGGFMLAGGGPATNIAKWNGVNWQPLGDGLGTANAQVRCLAMAPDGSLYAGGTFTNSGSLAIDHIARWNGAAWSPLGDGVDGPVQAIAFLGTNVVIGGSFTHSGTSSMAGIAEWDGSQWRAVGGNITDGTVFTLASEGTKLYAGGSFTNIGGVAVSDIAKWNGTNWTGLAAGMNATVLAIVTQGGSVYASGDFTTAGSSSASRVARWDGREWRALNNALAGGNSPAVNVVAASGTNVYVGGNFNSAGGLPANDIARWDGHHWNPLGTGPTNGLDGMPWAIAVSPSGQVYVGGYFTHAGGVTVNGIARWDGTNWFPLGSGVAGDSPFTTLGGVLAMAFAPNGDLYVGGRFTSIGGKAVNSLARWNGTHWYDVGGGIASSTGRIPSVNTLLIQGTNVYVGGYFDRVGGTNLTYASAIAVWNGESWSALGSSAASPYASVDDLAADGTNLYACGEFTEIGGMNITDLARWNGQSWSAVASGTPFSNNTWPFAVAVYRHEVIVGGNFSEVNGQNIPGLARWMDNQWWPLGSGLAGSYPVVNSLSASPAGLFVGGNFTQAGGQDANSFAVWNLTNELPAVQFTTPTNDSVFNGYQGITLAANAASANGPVTSMQFFVDGNSLGIETNPPFSLTWSNLTSGVHQISATATDVTGAKETASVAVTVNLPLTAPIITQQPQSQTLSNGDTIVLTVQATGNGTLSYQWFRDGTAVESATNASLTLTNAQLADSAMYTVQVSDSIGTTTSTRAPVSVLQPIAPLWVQPVGEHASSPVIGKGGTVNVGTDGIYLLAFGANSAYQWTYRAAHNAFYGLSHASASIGTNNSIYFGSVAGDVYCLNPDGTKRWSFHTDIQAGVCPAIGRDGTIYISSLDGHLYALNPDGALKWAFNLQTTGGLGSGGAPAIAPNGTIYVASGTNVYALSPSGSNEWTYSTSAPFYSGNSPIIGADGTIYITSSSTNLYALTPKGNTKWIFHAAGPFFSSPVIGPDGTIYAANNGVLDPVSGAVRGRLYALAPDGTEQWKFIADAELRNSPAVSQKGIIYFGAKDGNFYALNPDGTERWMLATRGPIESSPAIRFDGAVYFSGGINGSLYAVPGTGALASSAWPMYQHDLRHSGNAATPPASKAWDYPFDSNQFDDQVNAVAVSGSNIYVGGNFHVAGGVSANHIAEWNGTNWLALGTGVSGNVKAIVIHGGKVYVGGAFNSAGGIVASNVAFWDGSQWHAMGQGTPAQINAFAVAASGLYAGGDFTSAGGAPANYVAKWDGTNWLALGGGANGPVMSLALNGKHLYAAVFDPTTIEEWDGSQWSLFASVLGNGGGNPLALAATNGILYAGGSFNQVNGVNANGIAEWDGSQWEPLGTGVADPVLPYVNTITLAGTNVYVGGTFTTAGGVSANRIARWDGSQWHALGPGISGATLSSAASVNAIGLANGSVYVGGAFLSAGGDSSIKHFAVWNDGNWNSLGPKVGFVDGAFHLFLTDQLGRSYGVEASTDLMHWTRVATFTNLGGSTEFIDTNSSEAEHRYYRTVIP